MSKDDDAINRLLDAARACILLQRTQVLGLFAIGDTASQKLRMMLPLCVNKPSRCAEPFRSARGIKKREMIGPSKNLGLRRGADLNRSCYPAVV
jgi:hypothetical protein